MATRVGDVPIDPATADNGCLWFAPGHGAGKLKTDDRGRLTDGVVASLDWRPVEVEPGQLVAFDSYAPHRSETNQTNTPRRTLYLTYNAAGRGDFRNRYYADKEAEFAAAGSSFASGGVRISISDDFLGHPSTIDHPPSRPGHLSSSHIRAGRRSTPRLQQTIGDQALADLIDFDTDH